MALTIDDQGTLNIPPEIRECKSVSVEVTYPDGTTGTINRACWDAPTKAHGARIWTRADVLVLETRLCSACQAAVAP